MFRFGKANQASSQHDSTTELLDEEWQEWMDWSRTADSSGHHPHLDISPRTSSESAHQLPSPQASVTSEFSPIHKKRKVSNDSVTSPIQNEVDRPKSFKSTLQNKSHSIVEKRYRTNLNQKIAELGECIPNLRGADKSQGHEEGSASTLKHKKETVLVEAIAYIKQLELRNSHLEQSNQSMQKWRLAQQVSKAKDGNSNDEDAEATHKPSHSSSPSGGDDSDQLGGTSESSGTDNNPTPKAPQGLIKVPDEWKRMWRGELTTRAPAVSQPSPRPGATASSNVELPGKKYLGRLMFGSVAGIMLMDGISNSADGQRQDRGLFALPALPPEWRSQIETSFRHMAHNYQIVHHSPLCAPFMKVFFVLCVLGLMLFIYLFTSKPPTRKTSSRTASPEPQPSPSVASPLEVRQRAFLTAIQTIWFPTHQMLPEMLALNIETGAYLVRQLLGWSTYSWLTGRSEEQEIARVRAWIIAIDAQLSGGDAEVSKSRLVLSLWASGTLPNSPAILMLKALHIRILFWQPSRWPWFTQRLHCVARRLATWQWKKGQRLLDVAGTKPDTEPLTEHLKALLAQPIEDVMTDENIRRAHNLTWNTGGSQRSCSDSMCEDTAMRGPLDALAVWFSTDTLTNALKVLVQSREVTVDESVLHQLSKAVSTSPTASLSMTRAMAATAVFDRKRRLLALRQLALQLSTSALKDVDMTEDRIETTMETILKGLPDSEYADVKTCVSVALALSSKDIVSTNKLEKVFSKHIDKSSGLLAWASIHHLLRMQSEKGGGNPNPVVEHLLKVLKGSETLDSGTIYNIERILKAHSKHWAQRDRGGKDARVALLMIRVMRA